jgi:periplasmic protein TonB
VRVRRVFSFRYRIPGALLLALALHALLLLWAATSGIATVLAEVFEPTRLEIDMAARIPEPLADPSLAARTEVLFAEVGALEVDEPPAPEEVEPEAPSVLVPEMLVLPPAEAEPPPLAEPALPDPNTPGDPRALAGKKSGAFGRDTRGVGAHGGAAGSGSGGSGAGAPGGTPGGTWTGPHAGVVGDGVGGRVATGVPGGGGVVVVMPVAQTTPAPGYPRLSRRSGEEGSVLCRLFLSELGEVTKVEVVESSGHERLDEAAKSALLTWRFHPRREGGRAVATTIDHRVVFKLEAG